MPLNTSPWIDWNHISFHIDYSVRYRIIKTPKARLEMTVEVSQSVRFTWRNKVTLKSIFSLVKKKSLSFLFNLVAWGALALSGRASGTRVRASLETQMVMNLPALQETWFDLWVGEIPWRREWLPMPAFLPGESHGQRSLAGYSPRGCKESETIERLTPFQRHYIIHISPVLVRFI